MQFHFHKNGFTLKLVLKQRHKGTQNWPIGLFPTNKFDSSTAPSSARAVLLLLLGLSSKQLTFSDFMILLFERLKKTVLSTVREKEVDNTAQQVEKFLRV